MAMGVDSAAGIAGLISLGVTVFQGCVQGFIILTTARHLGKDGDFLRCMIEWEQYRLFEWSQQAGLGAGDEADPALNWTLILDLLRQLEIQLTDTAKLRDRYGLVIQDDAERAEGIEPIVSEDTAKESSLRKLSLRLDHRFFLSSSRIIHERNKSHPFRRLRWAVIDKEKLEGLLQDIRQILGCLWDILTFNDRRYIRDSLGQILRNAIVQTENESNIAKVSELAIIDRQSAISAAGNVKRSRQELDKEAQAFSSSSLQSRSQKIKRLRLKAGLLSSYAGFSGKEREIVDYDGLKVLVEFKSIGTSKVEKDKLSFRLENLTILLNETTDSSFHTLRCLGLIKQIDRYLMVFELPYPVPLPLTAPPSAPKCLTLTDLQNWKGTYPNQETRVSWALRLAETTLQLHTASWVHKGIRPDNIIFFNLVEGEDEIEGASFGPYLSNFEFAREVSVTAFSETPQPLDKANAYRHPQAQGEAKRSFRPRFDVYALGLVLIEIGLWSSIDTVLGLPYGEIPKAVLKTETLALLRGKLAFALPRGLVEAVTMALTYRSTGTLEGCDKGNGVEEGKVTGWADQEDRDGEDHEEEEDWEWVGDDSVDIQQSIVTKIRQCL